MSVYNHTGHVVSDLDRAKDFYINVLGFRLWYELTLPDEASAKLLGLAPPLGFSASYLVLDGFVLELMHFAAPEARAAFRPRVMNEPGLTHLSFSVEDISATARLATEHGGSVVDGSDVGVAVMIRDPDGQLLELLTNAYPGSRPPRPVSEIPES
jgi:lactoylglutathione lyase